MCVIRIQGTQKKIEATYFQDTFPVSIISTDVQNKNSKKTQPIQNTMEHFDVYDANYQIS